VQLAFEVVIEQVYVVVVVFVAFFVIAFDKQLKSLLLVNWEYCWMAEYPLKI